MNENFECEICGEHMEHMTGSGVSSQWYCTNCGENLRVAHNVHRDKPKYDIMTFDSLNCYLDQLEQTADNLGITFPESNRHRGYTIMQSCEVIRKLIMQTDYDKYTE